MKMPVKQSLAVAAIMASISISSVSVATDVHHATTTDSTTTTPPPDPSLTQITNEAANLRNTESQTLAQQQTSEVNAIQLQAKNTMQSAQQMKQGAKATQQENQAEKQGAATQTAQATEQALSQGVSQTQQVAEQMKQSNEAVTSDMMQMVQTTKGG